MALTRNFKETIALRAQKDSAFRQALFTEALECMLSGDLVTGKAILRDYINATVGFEELGHITDKSSKSLMRMLSPDGNPRADNLFSIIGELQKHEGINLHVSG